MKLIVIIEKPNKQSNLNKLVEIFKSLKTKNSNLEIELKIAKRTDAMRNFKINNDDCLIIFGSNLYKYLLTDINEFDALTGNNKREIHKFSYFVRNRNKHYFIAFMPPIDFTITKPDTIISLKSLLTSLEKNTKNFNRSISEYFFENEKEDRKKWPLSLIENGLVPNVKLYFNYDEIKAFLYNMLDLPDWHHVAIDVETTGLKIWNKDIHDIKIMSFSYENNIGHAINLGLPGLVGCFNSKQLNEINDLVEKYIFEKNKTFYAWKCEFDIFSICNKYNRSYNDFVKANNIIDGMHMLHILTENRKLEGYNLKAAVRDYLNFPQYSYIEKYLDYISNWKNYSVEQIMEASNNSMKYAAEDAAGEFEITKIFLNEIDKDELLREHKKHLANKIMAVKLEAEWNGLTVDYEKMIENSISFSGWELDNIVKNTIDRCKNSTDNKCHTDMFITSTTTGRLLYGKPYLNSIKIGSNIAKYFVADKDRLLLYIDLESADLRSAALTCQDENLIVELNNTGDFYINFAKQIFSSYKDNDRNIAKQFILSMLNLAGEKTIAKETGVSLDDVKYYKKIFYNKFPNMLLYKNELRNFLKENKYVFSVSFRKRRFSDEELSDEFFNSKFLSAHNFAFQSATTDIMNFNCFRYICDTKDIDVKLVWLNVDAAVFSVPKEKIKEAIEKLKVFEEVPNEIIEGTRLFSEKVLKNKKDIILPIYKYKYLVGKNMKDMENFNADVSI
jgi:DNA polymerase I-like protein with 3'-5' exonuclease and polymerase domains